MHWHHDSPCGLPHWVVGGHRLRDPDVTTSVTQMLGQHDDVVTFREVAGTIVNDLPNFGIEDRGQQIGFLTADIFQVRRNKIVARWEVATPDPFVALAFDAAQQT